MKILVTGGAGFIGSHLCEHFLGKGHTVICLDNLANGDLNNVRPLFANPKFKWVYGDVRDKEFLERIMPGVQGVFHLAAQIHVDKSFISPEETIQTNIGGILNILEASRRYDVEKIICASSSEVYGCAEHFPIKETEQLESPHIYGSSKIAGDRLAYAYFKTYGMDISITRCFNTFGARQSDSGYGGAIAMFTKRALNKQPPIIYGIGTQTRDYVYIKDIVDAYDLVLRSGRVKGEAINFGTGKEITINELAVRISNLCGAEITPVHVDARPGEVRRLLADSSKAQQILGWKAKYSLEEGLKEYIDWYKNYRGEQWLKP